MTERLIGSLTRGFNTVQYGNLATISATITPLSLTGDVDLIKVQGVAANTSAVYMGFDSSTTVSNGWALDTNTSIEIPYRGNTLYFISTATNNVRYQAFGK